MARKTYPVDALRDKVNHMIAAPGATAEGRVALAVLIESVLMDTHNYRGFRFLDYSAETRQSGDETRRYYF